MPVTRRHFIKKLLTRSVSLIVLGFSKVSFGQWLLDEFSPATLDDALSKVFPVETLHKTHKIKLKLPKTAENGSVVPITITSSLPNISHVYILSEKNPVPLIAKFTIDPRLEPYIGARFKMQESCDVIVVVKSGDQYYQTRQFVKVTLGGCGG